MTHTVIVSLCQDYEGREEKELVGYSPLRIQPDSTPIWELPPQAVVSAMKYHFEFSRELKDVRTARVRLYYMGVTNEGTLNKLMNEDDTPAGVSGYAETIYLKAGIAANSAGSPVGEAKSLGLPSVTTSGGGAAVAVAGAGADRSLPLMGVFVKSGVAVEVFHFYEPSRKAVLILESYEEFSTAVKCHFRLPDEARLFWSASSEVTFDRRIAMTCQSEYEQFLVAWRQGQARLYIHPNSAANSPHAAPVPFSDPAVPLDSGIERATPLGSSSRSSSSRPSALQSEFVRFRDKACGWPTATLREHHKQVCADAQAKRHDVHADALGHCSQCNKPYKTLKDLDKHRSDCQAWIRQRHLQPSFDKS